MASPPSKPAAARGRPKGARNKPKTDPLAASIARLAELEEKLSRYSAIPPAAALAAASPSTTETAPAVPSGTEHVTPAGPAPASAATDTSAVTPPGAPATDKVDPLPAPTPPVSSSGQAPPAQPLAAQVVALPAPPPDPGPPQVMQAPSLGAGAALAPDELPSSPEGTKALEKAVKQTEVEQRAQSVIDLAEGKQVAEEAVTTFTTLVTNPVVGRMVAGMPYLQSVLTLPAPRQELVDRTVALIGADLARFIGPHLAVTKWGFALKLQLEHAGDVARAILELQKKQAAAEKTGDAAAPEEPPPPPTGARATG